MFNLYFCVVDDSQPPKEPEGGRGFEAESSQGGEPDEKADGGEKDKVEGSAASQEETATDAEKERESALAGLPMGLGMAASDFRRLQANAREFLCLASPIRRTLFGNAATSAAPSTPLNHSKPTKLCKLERQTRITTGTKTKNMKKY